MLGGFGMLGCWVGLGCKDVQCGEVGNVRRVEM
jgi:hypothetical protein